jgi:hypothetical protein
MYAEAPYLAELYRDDLESRVVHPANLDKRDFAPPLLLHRGLKRWYLPGSADDLVLHTSCVVACHLPIVRYMPADSSVYDYGPPLLHELTEGSWGHYRTMLSYWARLERAMQGHLANGFSHVLFADVASCIESVNPERLSALLRESGADEDAVRVLDQMHRSWRSSGCRGLALTGGFRVLIKPYFKAVDDRLCSQGLTFLRLQDDFRVLCDGEDDARAALRVLSDALACGGFALNQSKTHIFSRDELRRFSRKMWQLNGARTLSGGIGLPALADALVFPALRVPALHLLRLLYGHRCTPV